MEQDNEMLEYTIDLNPTITVDINTNETAVNVTTWKIINGVRSSAVSMTINTATQIPSNPGRWDWYAGGAFVTKPTTDINLYETLFKGVKYGQGISVKWKWYEELTTFNGVVYLDVTGGGTPLSSNLPYTGSIYRPVDNLADALIIRARINGSKIILKGALTLDRAVDGLLFEGLRGLYADSIVLNNQSSILTKFYNLGISGQANSIYIYADFCFLTNVLDYSGAIASSTIVDYMSKKVGYDIVGMSCNSFPQTGIAVGLDFQNGAGKLAMSKFSGLLEITNFNNAGAVAYLAGEAIDLTLGATVLQGNLITEGSGDVQGTTGRTMMNVAEYTKTNIDGVPGQLNIVNKLSPASVADIYSSKHQDAGTLMKVITDTLADALAAATSNGSGFNSIPDMAKQTTLLSAYTSTGAVLTAGFNAGAKQTTLTAVQTSTGHVSTTADSVLNRVNLIPTNPLLSNATGSTFTAIPDMAKESVLITLATSTGNIINAGFLAGAKETSISSMETSTGHISTVADSILSRVNTIPTNPLLANATGSTFTAIPNMAQQPTLLALQTSTGHISQVVDEIESETDVISTMDNKIDRLITSTGHISQVVDEIDIDADMLQTIDNKVDALITSTGHISIVVDDILAGGTPLDPQAIRDAMKLAPSAGASATNSVDDKLNALITSTGHISQVADEIDTKVDELITSTGYISENMLTSTGMTHEVAEQVWDAASIDHNKPNTMGKLQNTYRVARFVR